jgi:hypothetical protein
MAECFSVDGKSTYLTGGGLNSVDADLQFTSSSLVSPANFNSHKPNKKMSSLSEIYLKKETLETLLKTVTAKGENGVSITISTSDDSNQYGQNVTSFVSQTKEQREAKANKYYVGNGKVFWTDGKITVAKKKEEATAPAPAPVQESFNDLPF